MASTSQSLVGQKQMADGNRDPDKLSTGGLSAGGLSAGGLSGGSLSAGSISAGGLSGGSLSAGGLSGGSISAGGLSSVGSVSSATTVAAAGEDRSTCSSSAKVDKEDDYTLGPLPKLWEKAYTSNGEAYFIDHNTGTSHWLDPRLSRFRKKSLAECREDELPFGWERIECSQYGAYFIDHVNRRTQYENPVIQARRSIRNNTNVSEMGSVEREVDGEALALRSMLSRDPAQLTGHRFTVTLLKSSQGLGFTLVGGASESNDDTSESQSCEDFLQIKSIVPNSPAWLDGALRTGDLLVRVGGNCVLGTGHARVARLFQDIPPGTAVTLELCRGYPLPFDPNDPNTRVLTTVAVEAGDASRMRHLTEELRERFNLEEGDKRSTGSSLERSSRAMNRSYQREHLDEPEDILLDRPNHLNRSFELEHRMSQLNRSLELERLTGVGVSNSRSSAANRSLDLDSHTRSDALLAAERLPARCPSADHLLLDSVGNTSYLQDGGVLTLRLMKGAAGFGFTIADSVHGQKVKKVLDRVRCGGLREGDLLLSINQTSVTNMSHAHVVQVLKECPQKKEATIKVVRRPNYQPKSTPSSQPKQTSGNTKSRLAKDITSLFRSKTPTADLYSTQPKEILPSRPKTPLVDTRNMTTADNYINLGVGYSQEDLTSASISSNPQQISPNSANSYKFVRKRRNSSNLNTSQSNNIDHTSSNGNINSNHNGLQTPTLSNTTGENISINNDNRLYRGSGVGANVDVTGAILKNGAQNNNSSTNGSAYLEDLDDTSSSRNNMMVQALALNESNMAAAYGGVGNSSHHANSVAGESSDNGGFSEEVHHLQNPSNNLSQNAVIGASNNGNGNAMSATGVGRNSGGNNSSGGSAAGCFSCYNAGGTDSPLAPRNHSHQHNHANTNLPMNRHNYDEVSPVAVDWGNVGPNHQTEEIIDPEADMVVILARGAAGFGFRIVGGTEEGSQVAVGHIVPGGACDMDGQICPGDLITSVDGVSALGASHRSAVASVCRAASNGQVTLGIKKNRNNNAPGMRTGIGTIMPMRLGQQHYLPPVQQNHILMDNNGHINNEIPIGNTPRHYIQANNNSSPYYNYYQENNYALNGGGIVPVHERMPSSHTLNYETNDSSNSPYPTYYNQNGSNYHLPASNFAKNMQQQVSYSSPHLVYGDQPIGDSTGQYSNLNVSNIPYDVVVQRSENEGFGFVIISSTNKATSTIGQLIAGSPAARCGVLHVGDTIVAINHTPIRHLSHGDIVTLIKHSGYSVTLTIQPSGH